MSFVLPATFRPDYSKIFTTNGVNYTIAIQNLGLQEEAPGQAPHLMWHYAIFVGDEHKLVETGPFRHDPSDRELSDEAVVNNLATFYGGSTWVQECRPSRDNLIEVQPIDTIVLKCAAFMFQELITETGTMDYDIIAAEQNELGWQVVLNASPMPERMFEFICKNGYTVTVNTYVKAHSFNTKL